MVKKYLYLLVQNSYLHTYLYFKQFNIYYDADYISIKEIDSFENQKLVAYLVGPDTGPKSILSDSNWDKKSISISTQKMIVEFKSDEKLQYYGFFANIHFTPIPSKECESWLDMYKKDFKSPNYPQPYHDSRNCTWLITVQHDYHITLDFLEFYVIYNQTY